MTTQKEQQISPDAYRQALDKLALKAVCIEELNATCNRDMLNAGKTTINLASKTFSRQTPDEYFSYITYQLTGLQAETPVLKIEATFCVIFDTDERVPDGFSDVFDGQNLPITTLPYLRELIASLTGRMGLQTLTIPYDIYSGSEDTSSQGQALTEKAPSASLDVPPRRTRRKQE